MIWSHAYLTAIHRSACRKFSAKLICLLAPALLAGCAQSGFADLRAEVDRIKRQPAGRIAPVPEFKTYEGFHYTASELRDPFTKDVEDTIVEDAGGGLQPDRSRHKEALEGFPLDTLKFVGNLELNEQNWAIITAPDGLVYRVKAGNYLGQNYGKITGVSETQLDITELVSNGRGGWIERQAALALSE